MKNFHNKSNKYVYQIVLKVENIEKSLGFYKNILGFRILNNEDNEVSLTADGVTPIIVLTHKKDIVQKIPNRAGLYHFALLLPDRSHLGSLLKNLNEKAYAIDGGSDHKVSEALYLKDPDGNGIEIYSDIDSDKWTWEDNEVKMTTNFLDYEELISLAEDVEWKGMPEATLIGHIHLHVSDLEKAKEFYVTGLGFEITATMGGSAVFLSDAGYHHHIAFNTWNGTGIDPLPENSAGMEYFTILFPDKHERNSAADKIRELGYKIFEENNDLLTKDPAGNLIKLII